MIQSQRKKCINQLLYCLVGLIVFTGLYQTASCQPGSTANAFLFSADNDYVQSFYALDQNVSGELKSKSRAIIYSLASTAVPAGLGALVLGDAGVALIAIGVAAGPSAGIAYAGDYGRAGTGVGIRASGAGIAALGSLVYLFESFEVGGSQPVGNILMVGGLSLIGISALYDIFIASPKAVKRYNERLEGDRVEMNPWINTKTGGAGLSLRIDF